MPNHNIVIIGGGIAGYSAAIAVGRITNAQVTLIERENNLGGICLNWGCIPTKALLKSAEVMHYVKNADIFGIKTGKVSHDFSAIIRRSRQIADKLAGGIDYLIKKNAIKVVKGNAVLTKPNLITVQDKSNKTTAISADYVIIATGAGPMELPNMKTDGKYIWNYKHAMTAQAVPKRLLIVGSGAIGTEFASFYNAMGSNVTVIEMQNRIMPGEDAEISAFAASEMQKKGINLLTNTQIIGIQKKKNAIITDLVHNKDKISETFDKIIVAVGIKADLSSLNVKANGIQVENNSIVTDPYTETTCKNIFAIGDVAGKPWLAHKAAHEAALCADKIADKINLTNNAEPLDTNTIPRCTYCEPQIASLGLTEEAAKKEKRNIKIGRFNYKANGQALVMEKDAGFVKVILCKDTGELLGAHIVGAGATEMINVYSMAKRMEATDIDFKHAVMTHPSLSEMLTEAIADADGQAINH